MLCVNVDEWCYGFLLRFVVVVRNSLQTPCQAETMASQQQIEDLVDDLCQMGVKQRVFLHVNEVVDTLGGLNHVVRNVCSASFFPVVFTAPAPTKRAANDFFA